jgi:hypothetical protein
MSKPPAKTSSVLRSGGSSCGKLPRGAMTENDEPEPTQKTPKGAEIPLPKRGDVMRAFEKVAKAPDPDAKPSDAGSASD